jgi:hypothetical protein
MTLNGHFNIAINVANLIIKSFRKRTFNIILRSFGSIFRMFLMFNSDKCRPKICFILHKKFPLNIWKKVNLPKQQNYIKIVGSVWSSLYMRDNENVQHPSRLNCTILNTKSSGLNYPEGSEKQHWSKNGATFYGCHTSLDAWCCDI